MPELLDDITQIKLKDNKEEGKHAPAMIFLRLTERFDEAMAMGRNPYQAYRAWHTALDEWALEDPKFLAEAEELHEMHLKAYAQFGAIPIIEYVASWRQPYFGVMRRMGLFDSVTASKRKEPKTEDDLGVN